MKRLIIEWAIKQLTKEEKHRILSEQETIKKLFNTLNKNDIFTIDKDGVWWYKNRTLTENEVRNLISEAYSFSQSTLYKMLQAEIKYKANKNIYEKAETVDHLIAGKLWLYTLDILKEKINQITAKR